MIQAEIILDSKNEFGNRITTFKLTFPRIVLAEFNTHRMISRNSASSRAIPFEIMLKNVEENPFRPIKFLKEHKGMQGFDYWDKDTQEYRDAKEAWFASGVAAIESAKRLSSIGVTKQFCNRLLEPFMWHTVIATATEWENFFALRAHPMAEIHIQDLAYKMLEEYNKSEPQLLKPGQWHIPFNELINETTLKDWGIENYTSMMDYQFLWGLKASVSAGICAGISYGRVKDKIDPLDILDLFDSLVKRPYEGKRGTRTTDDPIHASPTEHQARVMTQEEYIGYSRAESEPYGFIGPFNGRRFDGMSGNFKGFIQYRKMLSNENAKDERVIKK